MARFAAILGLVVVVAGALHWWRPFLTEQRAVIASAPSPGPRNVGIAVPLKPGSRLCVAPVAIDRASAKAQFRLSAARRGPAFLAFEASAGAYRSSAELRPILRRAPTSVVFPMGRPPGNVTGEVCVRNTGRSPVSFVGTNDPLAIGLARTRVDGKELPVQAVELELLEARTQSVLGRLGTIVHRAADFTGNLMPFWLAWLLVVALVIGTPFAIFAAFWVTLRADETR
jgi:hypothetical protein